MGRSPSNNIVVSDDTVSELHAEIVIAEDGRLFVSDCASSNGTFVLERGEWYKLRQRFVGKTDLIRLGAHEASMKELISNASDISREGPVEFDLETGKPKQV